MLTASQIELRKNGIGGSDAPVVLGLSGYKSKLALHLEKTREVEEDPVDAESALWGQILETPIADEFSKRTGYQIRRQPTKFSKEHPFMLVNMDRQIIGHARGPGLVEIKNFNEFKAREINTIEDVPDAVYVQVQHGLAVTGYTWGMIVILVGGQRMVHFAVERHEEFIAALIQAERVFWEGVLAKTPPGADGSDSSIEAIKKLFPKDSGRIVTFSDEGIVRLAKSLSEAKAREKAAKDEWDERKNAMKMLMGDATQAIIPGYGEISWKCTKTQNKKVFDEETFAKEQPELYAKYLKTVKTGGDRRFLDKPDGEKEAA